MRWNIKAAERANRAAKVLSPEEKAARTMGRLVGRITPKQRYYLDTLGIPRDKTGGWTKDHASKEIARLTAERVKARAVRID